MQKERGEAITSPAVLHGRVGGAKVLFQCDSLIGVKISLQNQGKSCFFCFLQRSPLFNMTPKKMFKY